MSASRSEPAGEAGFTIVETMITMVLLSIAVVAVCSTLVSASATTDFARKRNDATDQLRVMTANFSKDVRQGVRATSASPSSVSLETYVDGTLRTVTWRAVGATGGDRFERVVGTSTVAVYVVDLTTRDVFSYDRPEPAQISRIGLALATRPDVRRPPIEVSTAVEMRNVP